MKQMRKVRFLITAMCVAGVLAVAVQAEALVLRGMFPIRNGMYWNFSDNATQQTTTWAVLGDFNRSGVGTLIVLARQGEGFLALREEWDGLYLHGDYRTDGFAVPDTPILFMPFEIDFDRPIISSARMRVYADGPNAQKIGEYDKTVTITLQGLEDIVVEDREIRNCAVLVKKTSVHGNEITETFWLAPSIGPVKMRIEAEGTERTYELQTYQTDRGAPAQEISLDEYFPVRPGTVFDYRDTSGELVSVEFGPQEEFLGHRTVMYSEPAGDVYYLSRDARGLVIPIKRVAVMGLAFVSLPPDRPPVLLPARSKIGRLNHSLTYLRPSRWPSLQPRLDFYPESEIASVIVGIEDVTVEAGTYRNCIKVCFSSVERSYNVQREKIRSGFIWFAPGVGEVKRTGLSLANAYLEETPDYIYQTENWELSAVRQVALPETVVPVAEVPLPEHEVILSADDLVWQGNSKKMFDATLDAVPFLVRRMARGDLLEAVIVRAGPDGAVTEDAVIDAVEANTPERMRARIMTAIEQMKTP